MTTIQGYNVGTDVSFAIMDQFGDVFSEDMMGLMTQFNLRSVDVKLKVTPINNGGVPVLQTLPNGLRGQMSFVRVRSIVQPTVLGPSERIVERGHHRQFYVAMNVRNRDSSVDKYVVSGLQFSDWDFGDFRGTKEVDLRLSIEAAQMQGSGTLATILNNLPGV